MGSLGRFGGFLFDDHQVDGKPSLCTDCFAFVRQLTPVYVLRVLRASPKHTLSMHRSLMGSACVACTKCQLRQQVRSRASCGESMSGRSSQSFVFSLTVAGTQLHDLWVAKYLIA